MKVSLNWIAELTQIPSDRDLLIQLILSRLGEVEHIEEMGAKYRNIILAKIVEAKPHPAADTLGVYMLDIGQTTYVQVVAGDRSLKVGDKVAYFPPESRLPFNPRPEKHDGVVKAVELRGERSDGMLASEKELDLGSDHSKVMVIETDLPTGTPIADVLDLDDTLIEIENKALTNRPDCFGIIGIAREIAGITDTQFKSPKWYTDPTNNPENSTVLYGEDLPLLVQNNAEALCHRYTAAVMKNISIAPSPWWLKVRLIKSGIRPINNIVDITNYIMVLTGQPLHAFDYDKLKKKDPNGAKGAVITIRTAKGGESITTLDGQTHELSEDNLLICDSTNPIALAGIMGGIETEIDENTSSIVIESANFDMYNNRKSSMQLGIFTDAVTRFSKGLDPQLTMIGATYALQLVRELTGGVMASELIDLTDQANQITERSILVDLSYLNSRLGTALSREDLISTLTKVELGVESTENGVIVKVPSYRRDLNIQEDIHEEIARLRGYDKIPITLPKRSVHPVSENELFKVKKLARQALVDLGSSEVLTYNFVSLDLLKRYGEQPESSYKLTNPLSPELQFMRTSIIPSLLEKVRRNLQTGLNRVNIFELNKAHHKTRVAEDGLPIELELLGLVIADEDLSEKVRSPFYHIKNYWEQLRSTLGIEDTHLISSSRINIDVIPEWFRAGISLFDLNASALIIHRSEVGDRFLGYLGELNPTLATELKLPNSTLILQIDLEGIVNWYSSKPNYQEPSRFPYITYDLCFLMDSDVPYSAVIDPIHGLLDAEELRYSITPVDIYSSDDLESKGQKQITIRISISDPKKTLNNDDAKEYMKKVARAVRKETNAVLKE